jgi:protein-tyrosine phosphatase
MITNNIGVGSCDSNYKDFDVIIDLNYPENNVKEGEIDFYKKDKKIIIKIGLIDREIKENESYKYIREIIPVIYKYYSDKNILFHCYAGMSRSAFFAVAYLSYSEKITIKEAYDLVKSKRKFIKINKGFMNALEKFENSNKE